MNNNKNNTKKDKKNDGKFHSKTIKHNPQNESARAVFGQNDLDDNRGNESEKRTLS